MFLVLLVLLKFLLSRELLTALTTRIFVLRL